MPSDAAAALGAAACLLLLGSCSPAPDRSTEIYVFGTLVEVTLGDADRATAERVFAQLQEEFQAMHRDWHAWEPGLLTHVNESFALGQPVLANPRLRRLVALSQQYEKLTEGRFNAAIGQLVASWGFHASDFPVQGPPPSEGTIQRLLAARPSALDIEMQGVLLNSRNPAVQLDLGGIAKGFAVDLACELIRRHGVGAAIVNAGGDLRAFGRERGRGWRIAVRNPLPENGGEVLGGITVHGDEAIFTSGGYARFRQESGGARRGHILDPRTGFPAEGLLSATVIAAEGALADAAATALVVAGLDAWQAVAAALHLTEVLLVTPDGRVHVTPEMRLRFEARQGVVLEELTRVPPDGSEHAGFEPGDL